MTVFGSTNWLSTCPLRTELARLGRPHVHAYLANRGGTGSGGAILHITGARPEDRDETISCCVALRRSPCAAGVPPELHAAKDLPPGQQPQLPLVQMCG